MSDRIFPQARINELHNSHGEQRLSYGRLVELLNTCAFNEMSARGLSAAFHHDLVVALLLLERGWDRGEPGPTSQSDEEHSQPDGRPARAKPGRSLEAAARDLLSFVQNKQQPMTHPDNLRLTNEGETILVNEARLWILQLALPRRTKSDSSS